MFTHEILSKFDTSKFLWKSISNETKPESYSRALCGAEFYQEFWNRLARGDQILFFALHVDIADFIPRDRLLNAARQSWISLRYHVPTIATSTYVTDDDDYRLKYTPATSEADVVDWMERTLIVSTCLDGVTIGLDQLREQLAQAHIPSSGGDQTWLHLVLPPGPDGDDGRRISDFGLLIHTSHTPFDGVGLKILTNRFLQLLAEQVGQRDIPSNSDSKLEWGKEVTNLLPATMNILHPSEPQPIPPTSKEEPTFHFPYYSSLNRLLEGLGASMQNPYGFRPHQKDTGRPLTKRIQRTFTRAESETVLQHLKLPSADQGHRRGYTVAQLAHAALAMLVAFNNPPPSASSSPTINHLGLVNCRYLLAPPYSSRDGYPGYALGVTVLSIPVSLFLSQTSDKETLVRVLRYTRKLYEEQKRNEGGGLLSNMAQGAEISGKPLREAWKIDQVPPNQNFSFSSDGKGESYLDSEFFDEKGNKVFELTRFWTSLNRIDPGPFFRISSWKSILDISADYNANIVSKGEVEEMMDKWKEFILLVSDLDKEDY